MNPEFSNNISTLIKFSTHLINDEFVKSLHSRAGKNPVYSQGIEINGFPLSRERRKYAEKDFLRPPPVSTPYLDALS